MDIRQQLDNEIRLLQLEYRIVRQQFLINAIAREYRVSKEEIEKESEERHKLVNRMTDFKLGYCLLRRDEGY